MVIVLLLSLAVSSCSQYSVMSFDYSEHSAPNEADYKTILGDLRLLKQGKRIIVYDEPIIQWERDNSRLVGEYSGGYSLYDIRSMDASSIDFSYVNSINELVFDSDTIWGNEIPFGANPDFLLDYNMNPGLGIRELHQENITGKGVGIAIIDHSLLVGHSQYKEQLMLYEKIHSIGAGATQHGTAVASIAVGKDTGVAPDAKLYFIANTATHFGVDDSNDLSITADALHRVLDINHFLPNNEKIRVVSISIGYNEDSIGYHEMQQAIELAEKDNIFVVTTTPNEYYDFILWGLLRDYDKDPDTVSSYRSDIQAVYLADPNVINVPRGSRTIASWRGVDSYELSYRSGLSWAVPWLAGFYALCCQVEPNMTPQYFVDVVKRTSVVSDPKQSNKTIPIHGIIDPARAISEIIADQKMCTSDSLLKTS